MRTIYLHIGLHKTGTTSIQDALFDARARLLAHGIDYFGIAANHSQSLFPLFSSAGLAVRQQRRLGVADDEIEQRKVDADAALRQALEKSQASRLVISAEALSMLPAPGVAKLHAALAPHAARIKVIAYIREPYGAMTSAFLQFLRSGYTEAELLANPPWPKYSRLQIFIDAFGRQNVDVRVFDRRNFAGGDLLTDFLAAIDAPLSLRDLLPARMLNVSLSQNAADILSAANARHVATSGHAEPQRSERIARWLSYVTGPPFACPPQAYANAAAILEPELRWLRETLGRNVFVIGAPPQRTATLTPSAVTALAWIVDAAAGPRRPSSPDFRSAS